jgi:glutathione peroxidase
MGRHLTRRGALASIAAFVSACVHGSPPPGPPPRSLDDIDLVRLDGAPLSKDAVRGKVVLFVNVASKCGFTPQYGGLQALHRRYGERGLVVVGAPCNQFLWQEPGGPDEIGKFCKDNYGVEFPILEKQDVNGPNRSRLYQWLVASPAGGGTDVAWNFEKFLVGRDGKVVARWASAVEPESVEVVSAIEAAL